MLFHHTCRRYLLRLGDPSGMEPAHIQCRGTHVDREGALKVMVVQTQRSRALSSRDDM